MSTHLPGASLLLLLVPVLALAGHAWFLGRRFALSPYATPAIALGVIVTLLYASDYLLAMRATAFVLVLAGLALFGLELARWLRTGQRLPLRRGVLLLVLLAGLAVLLDLNAAAAYSNWDEFSHWGTIAKLVAELHTYHLKTFGVRSYFEDYPPGMALAAYYFGRLAGYSEPAVYFSHALVLLAALLPMIGLAAQGSLARALLAVPAGYFLVVVLGQGWSSALIDHIVGVLFGCTLCTYLLVRERPPAYLLVLLPVLAMLVLAKQSGHSFAQLTVGAIAVDRALLAWRHRSTGSLPAVAAVVLALWLVPSAVSASWKHHVTSAQLRSTFSSTDLGAAYKKLGACCHSERELAVMTAFFRVFTGAEKPVAAQPGNLVTTAGRQLFQAETARMLWRGGIHVHSKILLFLAALAVAGVALARPRAGAAAVLPALLFAGLGLYTLTLLAYYLYVFSDYEARTVTSMTRYLNSFELGLAMAFGGALLRARVSRAWGNALLTVGVAALLLYIWSRTPHSHHYLAQGAPRLDAERTALREFVRPVVERTPRDARVYVLWQAVTPLDTGAQFWKLHHELRPRNTNLSCFSVGRPLQAEDIYSCPLPEAELRQQLAAHDYVAVGKGLATLQAQYPATFGRPDGHDRRIFRVVRQGADGKELRSLEPMESTAP